MDFEKLGLFYLGREYDLAAHKTTERPVLYDSRDLVTHAVCVGMTGSGKTGLCLGLLEEAAIDGVPVLAVDPKGDLANLLLTFPRLSAEEFAPWINADEARAAGLDETKGAAVEAIVRPEEMFDHPQLRANDMVATVVDPDLGPTTQIGVPIHLCGTPGAVTGPQPRVGEHNDELLRELGYSDGEIERLASTGAVPPAAVA